MCELNQEEVCNAVAAFNQERRNLEADYLVSNQFDRLHQVGRGYLAGTVFLLDNCFSTRQPITDSHEIIKVLDEKWYRIECRFGELEENSLLNDTDAVVQIARFVLPCILILRASNRQNYKFATKFLHWCTRKHFPIIDKHSRNAIRSFADNVILQADNPNGIEGQLDEYERVIRFCADCLNNNEWIATEMVAYDLEHQRQYPHYAVSNTPLRILDKYFFIEGQ